MGKTRCDKIRYMLDQQFEQMKYPTFFSCLVFTLVLSLQHLCFSDAFGFDHLSTSNMRRSGKMIMTINSNNNAVVANSDDAEVAATTSRRKLLSGFFAAASIQCSAGCISDANAEILQVGQCAGGFGEGCTSLSEGNDFIRTLQEKSAKKRDFYQKQALDAYEMKNYPDYFSAVGRYLVKKPDGSFQLYAESEFKTLTKAGKIRREQPPKAMGGKVTDFSQKPILVLIE